MPHHRQSFYICREDELGDPGSKGFEIESIGLAGFVVRQDGKLRAYENHCPHMGVSLNWTEDQFLDYDGDYIQCSMHGALFRISDGVCIHGPCNGRQLTALQVQVEAGKINLVLEK